MFRFRHSLICGLCVWHSDICMLWCVLLFWSHPLRIPWGSSAPAVGAALAQWPVARLGHTRHLVSPLGEPEPRRKGVVPVPVALSSE